MWRYRFLNLCFVIVVITLLAVQHSVGVFGPTARSGVVAGTDPSHRYPLDAEFSRRVLALANFGRAAAFLEGTWHRGLVFKEWWLEYNASQWEFFNAASPAETDLLEARFHVANAEVFTEGMSEKDRAIKELGLAEKSLQAAQSIVKATLTPQLTTIRDEVTAAEIKEQSEDASSTVPFETIKANLDHLIERVRLSKT